MQSDMHYYGTYAMARAAGLNKETCVKIACSAQFVDDNAGHEDLFAKDRAHLHVTATAHHATDSDNLEDEDQPLVWVPFHFLPGGQGSTYEERLVCKKNSKIAQEMFNHYLSLPATEFSPYLIGIAAHVYADTFSHYGFSGISSDLNRIDADSFEFKNNLTGKARKYIVDKWTAFKTKMAASAAESLSGGLGHGAAHTYPDRPFLTWQFTYEGGKKSNWRNNPKTFLEACEKLYLLFNQFAQNNPVYKEGEGVGFDSIRESVSTVLNTQANMKGRIKSWQEQAKAGALFDFEEPIPVYSEKTWLKQIQSVEDIEHSKKILNKGVFRFLQAAAVHRTFVLRELLPKYGLLVR